MDQEQKKQQVAKAAISHINLDDVVGVGTGTTVNYFIEELAKIKGKIDCAVASSKETLKQLKKFNIPVNDLNSVDHIDVYIDGADEVTEHKQAIKGGGGALTGEKILVEAAKKFICIVDDSKLAPFLGNFPLPIEVIPMARSLVGRHLVKIGGDPVYREGFITDYGNIILDVHNLNISEPAKLESQLNQIPGVVTNGLFARRPADLILLGEKEKVLTI